MKKTVVTILLLAVSALLAACTPIAQTHTPAPALALPRAVASAYAAGTRSADGNPGPNYWQNSSVHDIQLTVMPPDRIIRGTQTITYTNNSPRDLEFVPIRLYQNAHRPTAPREEEHPPEFLTEGVTINSFKVNGQEIPFTAEPNSPETLKIIKLPQPIPAGGEATFEIDWHYEIANFPAKEGVVDPTTFAIAYFFPRIAPIRDDEYGAPIYPGFDLQDFTYRPGREFNNDFADFDVAVTVPKDYLVWATGELQNPDEVLQPDAAKRYADSLNSDETITVATAEDLAAGQVTAQTDTVTWRWKAQDIPDFALGLSDHYTWDAGSVVGDPATGARVGVSAAYPESAAETYTTMVQDQRDIITFASTEWPGVAWPWPRSTVFLGNGDEEWPMMANDTAGSPQPGTNPRFVASHELMHQYFPFAMGINEQRYPILDEGWTTAFEYFFNSKDLGAAMEDQLFSGFRGTFMTMPFAGTEIPAIAPADALRGIPAGDNAYGKASHAYIALRNLLGDEAFKAGLHAFIERWEGKHPLPWDMFNTFNDVTGQDLNWFWHNWFYTDGYIDLSITGVTQTADGWSVDVHNTGGFAVPFTIVATYADGSTQTVERGVAAWKNATTDTVTLPGDQEPTKVEIQMGPFRDATPADSAWVSPNAAVPASPAG